MKIGPIEQIVLQSTPACNLNCSYCYLSEESRKDRRRLAPDRLGELFEKILSSDYVGTFLDVVWHAGEPLMLTPAYYTEAIETIQGVAAKHQGPRFPVRFYFQTNGTLINQDWCDFFNRNKDCVCVGVSCDGPASLHDLSRRNWASRGSFEKTRRGMEMLSKNGIPFGVIAVVTARTIDHADHFYDFFRDWRASISSFHFNLIEGASDASRSPYGSAGPQRYYAFVRRLLERSRATRGEAASLEIQNFNWIYDKLFSSEQVKESYRPESMSQPFKTLNIDVQGEVSTFYAGLWSDSCGDIYGDGRGLSLGNLFRDDLESMAQSPKLKRMADDFATSHRACESSCEYYRVCSGGFNLTKYKHHGTFDVAETKDCVVSVKAFTNAVLDDINEFLSEPRATERPTEDAALQ